MSQCYANHGNTPSVAASVVDFLNLHYSSHAALLHGNGFDTVPASFQAAIATNFLGTLGSSIGSTRTCGAIAGR